MFTRGIKGLTTAGLVAAGLSLGIPSVHAAGAPTSNTPQHSAAVQTFDQTHWHQWHRWHRVVDRDHDHDRDVRSHSHHKTSTAPVSKVKHTTTTTSNTAGPTVVTTKSTGTSNASAHLVKVPATSGTPKTIDGLPVVAVYKMTATAYGPSLKDNYPYGATNYFGKPLTPGTIAVDPSVIPLKSTVYVTGYHDASLPSGGFLGKAMDEGNAIKGHRIDIFMNDSAGVVSNFGVQPVTVYVLG